MTRVAAPEWALRKWMRLKLIQPFFGVRHSWHLWKSLNQDVMVEMAGLWEGGAAERAKDSLSGA